MLDIVLESIRAIIFAIILGYLCWFGKKDDLFRQTGWFYIVVGFALLLFGAVIDITDNFQNLNKFVVIGDTEPEAMLEKVVGFLLGSSLLAIGLWKWLPSTTRHSTGEEPVPLSADPARRWHGKWTLTIVFTITALVAIPFAAIIVNRVIGDLAERNLIRLAEGNTLQEARHLQSMAMGMLSTDQGSHPMAGEAMAGQMGEGSSTGAALLPAPSTLEILAGSEGLPGMYRSLVEGLNVARLSLLDSDGRILWSSDPSLNGSVYPKNASMEATTAHGVATEYVRGSELTDFEGVARRIDVMKMFLPIPDAASEEIIGVIIAERDVSEDVVIQVDDVRWAVFWTTVVTMGGLFLVLLGFIVAADVTIQGSRRRELAIVEVANRTLEDRVQERTRELEEAQDQLVRSEKLAAIGQLAGGVAHDLRNPLGAINNAIYYLKKRLGATEIAESNPRIGQFLQIAAEEVEHSNAIISDLMSFARVGVPSLSLTILGDVVGNALSTMDIRDNVHIVKQLDSDLPEVMADGEQLYRVFINLANNAQDAMPDGGELTVSTLKVDGNAEIAFRDTGVGISPDNMKKIFEPLFTTKTKGTGLGLAVSQQIVAKHGGSIQATSSPGEGTTFTVQLPLDFDQL